MAKKTDGLSYVTGFVQNKGYLFALMRYDELEEAGHGDTDIARWDRANKRWASFSLEWAATHLHVASTPTPFAAYATGPEGRVVIKTASKADEELIFPGADGPEGLGDIRDLRLIGETLYATGMNRQVYRRKPTGGWVRADTGVVITKPSLKTVHGFNSIDGRSEKDIYAAGFGGEMWRFDGKRWRQIESPTNLMLDRVRAVAKDRVYICGKEGVLLRGHLDAWEVVDHGGTDDELWDVEIFEDAIYLATDDAVFRLNDDDELEPVKLGKKNVTCGALHANDGVLMSVGRSHVLYTEDGRKWHEITP